MKNTTPLLAAAFLAAFSQGLQAQCPSGVTPASLVTNITWTYHADDKDLANLLGAPAFLGTFKANANGSITGSQTSNANGRVSRQMPISGQWQVYADCSGGVLQLAEGNQGTTWEFVFANNFTQMFMVSDVYMANPGLARVLRGTATKFGPAGTSFACPAGVNPLNVLNATSFAFHAESATPVVTTNYVAGSASTGTLRFSFNPADARNSGVGAITGTASTNFGTNVGQSNLVRLAPISGRYQVGPDCAWGTLQIPFGPYAVQADFLFVDPNFTQIQFLSTSATNGNNRSQGWDFDIIKGYAVKN